jgi:hypothetical protein
MNLCLAFGLDHRQHGADGDGVAQSARQLHDAARDRAFDFHRGLVGHHIGQRLVFADGVALGHMPAGDFRLRDAFADVGQGEGEGCHLCQSFMICLNA